MGVDKTRVHTMLQPPSIHAAPHNHRITMDFPVNHFARIDEYLGFPEGTLDGTDIQGQLFDEGEVRYRELIDYGRFLALLGHKMCTWVFKDKHIYIEPWASCPHDRIECGYAKVCTFARVGRLLLSANGWWYLTRPSDNLLVSNRSLHRNPIAIMAYVETSSRITVEAETEGISFEPVPEGDIDLDLPFYRIEFGAMYNGIDHAIVVRDGMITQSYLNRRKPFTMPIDGMHEAIMAGDYNKVACVDDESDERAPIRQFIPIKSAEGV